MSYIVPQKMPMRCFECGHISSSTMDGYSCKIANKSLASEHGINVRRPDWCPLIEIPPHGDLVDRNKLLRRAKKESTYAWKMNLHARTETILNQFIDWLDEAETVIEGSKT